MQSATQRDVPKQLNVSRCTQLLMTKANISVVKAITCELLQFIEQIDEKN